MTTPPSNNYAAHFRQSIVILAKQLCKQIREATSMPSEQTLKQALHVLSYLAKMEESWSATRDLLLVVAPKMEQAGYRDNWMPYLLFGIQKSQRHQELETEAELTFAQGVVHLASATYGAARTSMLASLQLYTQLNAQSEEAVNQRALKGQAHACNRLALIAYEQDNPISTQTYAQQALAILPKEDPERAFSYTMLGHCADLRREWETAIGYYEAALELRRKENNSRMVAWNLRNLGIIYKKQGNYELAIQLNKESVATQAENEDPLNFAAVSMNLGNIYIELNRFEDALTAYDKAEEIFRRANDSTRLAMLYANRGIALRSLSMWAQAERSLRASIELNQQLGRYQSLIHGLDDLALVYIDQGNETEALATVQQAKGYLTKVEDQTICGQLHAMLDETKTRIQSVW